MYLFIDNFGIKNKSYKKQVLRPYPWCSAVSCAIFQCSPTIHSGLGVIRCSVSALSVICCFVAPCPLVSVLLDAVGGEIYKIRNIQLSRIK